MKIKRLSGIGQQLLIRRPLEEPETTNQCCGNEIWEKEFRKFVHETK
jgi:hypothetical protein